MNPEAGILAYTWEKLFGAVTYLAAGPPSIRARLEGALHELSAVWFVPDLQALRPQLLERVTSIREQATSHGSIADSVHKMGPARTRQLARELVGLLNDVTRAHELTYMH